TWNPWDLTRTPGGSSSGSAAAVAARMLPLATGSQVRGSVIRPAALCGIIGMKPTIGALNCHGGFDPSPSLNHLGLLGGSLVDVWEGACHIAQVAGGDPGFRLSCRRDPAPRGAAGSALGAAVHVWMGQDGRGLEVGLRGIPQGPSEGGGGDRRA